ncbi:right-handed parallel beta-helix repeat-containing protein [Lacrimispora celerecrescens]|uniref:Right handed beta helix domain-containing protein n=1 Tax=Lacrimispora celerecrescens TaxID=29354 RepID=A0A084JFA0_9FIRM|nr:right-handed parallel beta-helix repeat-containing protein [Lacrimispora celerecrescens]KEZ87634.1 hypothetical protein IO98_20715 [Lacrimispora celerecrescens]
MTQFKRLIAFLLCLLMIFPTQELTILAETMSMDHVQAEEIISAEPIENGTDLIEETQQSEPTEDGEDRKKETSPLESIEDEKDRIKETRPLESIEDEEDRIKETLPLEPMEDEADRIKETLPLEPMEDEADRIKETLPLEPMEDETDRIKETLPLEPIKGGNSGVDRINKTLLLEPLEDDTYAIYWNPGGQLPAELATPSDATATASDASATKARMGKDSASGLSPARPVKTLEKAVERAKKLMENKGLDSSDITIYAMNPMEVADGELYVLNAGNMRIASWPERPYQSDALFYVNGGQLALMNVLLEAEDPAYGPDETELIYVRGGSLQMGQNVNINGCVIMDYNSELEDIKWKEDIATPSNTVEIEDSAAEKSEQMKKVLPFQMLFSNDSETLNGSKTSTASKASTASKTSTTSKASSGSKVSTNRKASTASQAGKASFHIDNYRLDTSEENVELLEDRISASTWKEPIIELMEGFDGSGGEYLLKVKDDGRAESRELVTTLYADEATAEEFLDYFTLVESDNWSLQVETAAAAQLRDTGSGEESTPNPFAFEEVTLTSKTLIASRSLGDAPVIYWNPGPARTLDGVDYPAGRDDGVDGTTPFASFKTWEAAAKAARKVNGTVVAMQTLDLGAEDAGDYLSQLSDGVFYMASENSSLITSLGTWNAAAQPAVVVPKDKTLIMKDLSLGGRYDGSGNVTEAQTILVKEGDLIIDKNVKTEEKGYIQLNAFRDLKNHPIQVCSVDSSDDGDLRVFFGGINNNIEYRYVDVVVPGGELEDSIINDEEADDVGKALLHRVKLHIANRSEEYGGTSDNDWSLRQDTNEDDNIVTAQNLELYAIYYFDAIYIDGVEGDDGNYGASCNYPVKTWARARAIWQSEMTKSLEARHKAVGSMTLGEIEAHYPMPEVIYICNTVTVDSVNEWELEPRYDDARNAAVKIEIVSHIDHIAVQEEDNAAAPRHEAPKTMIEVTGSGALSIKDIYIRNMVDDTDSITIKVENGGTLTLKGDTTLNGTRLPSSGFTQKNLTLGCHIMVTKGHLEIDTTGSIEYKEQGVVAMGSETTVEMKKGVIQQNNSYRADYYEGGRTDHKAGGGVALSGGAVFTMDGGTITKNQTYQYGAGVYLKDTGTSFIMKKGKISGNSMPAYRYSAMNSANLTVYGVGIYADKDTVVEIGDGTGVQEDTLISDNTAYSAKGTGVFSNGTLTIDNAKISDNIGGGISTSNIAYVYGVGIFVGADGTLTMNKGLVSGNHGSYTSVANVLGAGIYIEAAVNNSHKITKSTVTGNKAGYEASIGSNVLDYSQGGGIYLAAGNALEITDNTTISYNRAARGGGIYAVGGSGRNISLILEKTIIDHNDAIAYSVSSYGDSGGIYFKGYGILTLKDGTKITNNTAVQHSGGLYMGDFTTNSVPTANIYMKASPSERIEISGNRVTESSTYGYGGGVSHFGGKWMAENVLIDNNEAVTKGGGVYVSSSAAAGIFRNMVFSNNRAVNGAALDIESGRYYLQDSEIEGNIAANRGGGIHLGTTAAYMYLSESTDGKFKIRNNRADYGGGIAITMGNTFVMNIAGPIQNHANVQGSNFCLDGYANIDILNGKFKQPDAAEQMEGVYNIYINDTSISTSIINPVYYNKYIDFSKVTFEKKTVGDPDVILLNSGNSFLTVLKEPPDSSGDFPIDLNKEAFQSGSIVLKPAGSITRVNMYPSDNLEEAWPSNFTYSNMDASSHLAYYQGGKLPRRSQLSGFKDEASPAKKNVIVLGEGVYLAGAASGGNDNNHYGTSPDDAVATFAKAKEILSDRIEAEAEKEGFAPFIYICGPVDIAANEPVWELDYNALLSTNENYAITEISNGDPVYEPQVRRFASFLRQPMIKVGNNIDFTIGRLIIDGMADKVVVADQGDKSPVINSGGGSHVTLTGNSMIRNNYYSALDISGELTLKGDIGDVNKQLYNNQSTYTVRLYGAAQMSMQGYSKIIAGDKVKKIGSFTSSGIWFGTTSSGASVSMDDNSAIIQEPDSELLDEYLIYSSSSNSTIEMKGNARLEVGNSAIGALRSNTGSKASMSGDARIVTLKDASLTYGAYVYGDSSLTMSDQAEIIYGGVLKSSVYGIYLSATTAPLSLKMQDKAAITLADNVTGANPYYGIYVQSGESPRVELLNNVKITGNLDSKISGTTYGIYAGTTFAKNVSILLNMDDGGFEDESVLIKDMGIGIYLGPAENCSIGMGKSALIDGGSGEGAIGICVAYHDSAASAANVLMKGHSKIRNTIYAVQFYNAMGGPINIKMEDYAAIEQNEEGIYEYATRGLIWRLNVELSNNARISGNAGSGIDLGGTFSWSRESGGFQDIILNDNAIIGGNVDYSSTDPTSGNKSSGIYATGPVKVTMNGASKISGNGFYDYNGTSANAPSSGEALSNSGIYLVRAVSTHRAGTAEIIMNDDASICDNHGGGIYAATLSSTNYHNNVIIELNGSSDGEMPSAPSIKGNTDALYLGADTTLKLKGEASVEIGNNPYETSSYKARAIDNYGYIELDGRSTVKGLIYMNNGTKPITMTHSAAGSTPKYDLHLVEGFTGNTVVKPDMIGIMDLTSDGVDGSQLVYFNKFSADGMADSRPIAERKPNLVLMGENNVYLSGNGNDSNSGDTSSTAVRTFKHARELLEGMGNYTEKANIIICGTVNVLLGDEDWSFGPGGYVKNTQSGDQWQPLVIRYERFSGTLIRLPYDNTYASTVTFKNITIDGGSENGNTILTSSQSRGNIELLAIERGKTAILDEGAVLQNNKAVTNSESRLSNYTVLGVDVYGGILEINGGTIRNMGWEEPSTYGLGGFHLASAVLVQGVDANQQGKLIMKSGQIINNDLNILGAGGTSNSIGTINVNGSYSNMEMRGGMIENNRVASNDLYPAVAGTIVNYNGNVTISGGIIRGNEGRYGSAIFYYGTSSSSKLIFSGGQISGNTTNVSGQQPVDKYSPIYVERNGFELYGGGADIRDSIYLKQTQSAIKVSDSIYQAGRSYRVCLNFDYFKKGSVVVEPDGNKVTNVTSYLKYFDVRSNPFVLDQGRTSNPAGNVAGVKEEQCLILMKAVYLDSEHGKDTNNGLKPSQAVKSFNKAKSVGATGNGTFDHYVIYIYDKASNIDGEALWTLPKTAYMCRYTGFPVYESDGTETQELEREYHGCLIEPGSELVFSDITIQGRRNTDSTEHNGDSLVNILSGVNVTVESGAVFSGNYNNGNYIAEDGRVYNLPSKGGAFQVAEGGSLRISGGEMKGNSAVDGSAIYLHASESNQSSLGQLYLTGSPTISGKVYLDGTADITSAYIQPDALYLPSEPLQISVSNDYNGRPLIKYSNVPTPGETELNHYSFDDAIKALYDIVNNNSEPNILELSLRKVIYLDGQHGSDSNDETAGTTPETAFKTLKRTFEEIKEQEITMGVLVYIVGTLDIDGEESDIQLMNLKVPDSNGTYHYEGYYMDLTTEKVDIRAQVYFKRYSMPKNYNAEDPVYEGYNRATLRDSLFNIDHGGKLTLSGIYLDGHSISSDSSYPTLTAPAVKAKSPLITVKNDGTLKCNRAEDESNSISTVTMFVNNVNEKKHKDKVVGYLDNSLVYEGSSAGIELLDGGTCILESTEFSNLALDNGVIGGTDVYSNGFLHFSYETIFGGSVFLEGFGTKGENTETSRYLTADVYGTPVKNSFQVLMRDPYMGRDVVHYPQSFTASATDAGYFLLEERVKDYFYLSNRAGYPHILELSVPVAVYIDGTPKGNDDLFDPKAGSTPKNPVRTLRRAFELLKTRGGNTIYVVNAIQVESDIQVTGMSYVGNDGNVILGSTSKVNIVRYIQPDFARESSDDAESEEYDVADYTGVLLNVKDGASARFSANVNFDGHSEKKESPDLPKGAVVSRNSEAKTPLITVEKGGTLNLLSDVALFDNKNTYADGDSSGQHGGAISNSGTTIVDGALFKNNVAAKGSVAYQDGTFTIKSAPENLADNPKAFYLTTENTGTPEQPVWGEDHVIQTAVAIPDNQIFDIDMDHAVKGRDVVRFTNNSAYNPNADTEQDHFHLGSTVPEELFLVEAENDPDVLELQDWEVLKVEVPADIYLVVCRKGSYDSTNKLMGVISDPSAGTDLFTAPEYTIKNKGNYDAKVFISGFENKTIEAGITADPMNLTASAAAAATANDLYLAVKGLDDVTSGSGFVIAETSLQPYAESPVAAAPVALGTLKKEMSGKFTFIGAVGSGSGFVEKYIDPDLVVEGSTKTQVQEYMDGSNGGPIKAKAKYLLKYKVEIDPSRRTP